MLLSAFPHEEERVNNPIPKQELDGLLQRAYTLLNVHEHEYDGSIRHTVVKETLEKALGPTRDVQSLHLAVKRREDNPAFVTWTGSDTVLGDAAKDPRFTLLTETKVTKICVDKSGETVCAKIKDLRTQVTKYVFAKVRLACRSLYLSSISHTYSRRLMSFAVALYARLKFSRTAALGAPFSGVISPSNLLHSARYVSVSRLSGLSRIDRVAQIVLKREIVDAIRKDPRFADRVKEHQSDYPKDPLPIPFDDPEPQVMIPYTTDYKWHCQVHRDAFSYGDVGPRADSRVVVDLRWFGKQDIKEENMVYFGPRPTFGQPQPEWKPGDTDIYGLPQATVRPSVCPSPADSLITLRSSRSEGPRKTSFATISTPSADITRTFRSLSGDLQNDARYDRRCELLGRFPSRLPATVYGTSSSLHCLYSQG